MARLVRSLTQFRRHWRELGSGDAVLGYLPLHPGEEVKLLDLVVRGVSFFPPVLAQLLARSKVAQAEVLAAFMAPGTFVAYSQADLTARLPEYHSRDRVVTKRDRAHLGLGVSLWSSLEDLYSLGGLQPLPFPLVVQPFVPGATDLRVVVVGDYREAYERINPHGFRKNLFQGGSSRAAALTPEVLDFCQRVMARGQFPYAILDLLLRPEGQPFLAEINLKGGLTGARLTQAQFQERVAALEEDFHRRWASS
jgi:ribosomal protein S6--L-glutamate ligase